MESAGFHLCIRSGYHYHHRHRQTPAACRTQAWRQVTAVSAPTWKDFIFSFLILRGGRRLADLDFGGCRPPEATVGAAPTCGRLHLANRSWGDCWASRWGSGCDGRGRTRPPRRKRHTCYKIKRSRWHIFKSKMVFAHLFEQQHGANFQFPQALFQEAPMHCALNLTFRQKP